MGGGTYARDGFGTGEARLASLVSKDRRYKPMVKSDGGQRESDGAVVLMTAGRNPAVGKGPDFGHAGGGGKREGMAGTAQPNYPDGHMPVAKVRQLRDRLWAAAKQSEGRRSHALYDRTYSSDGLWEAWERVLANRGGAGVDGLGLAAVEAYAMTGRSQVGMELEAVIERLNLFLRGWGNYFRTGNAATKFVSIDRYVAWRLKRLLLKKRGRNLRAGQADRWTRSWFHDQGLYKLMGTIRLSSASIMGPPWRHKHGTTSGLPQPVEHHDPGRVASCQGALVVGLAVRSFGAGVSALRDRPRPPRRWSGTPSGTPAWRRR